MGTPHDDDLTLLRRCLDWAGANEDEAEDRFNVGAFRGMLERVQHGRALSHDQRIWVQDVIDKLFGEPVYRNEWSAGQILKGRDVPTPAVLRNLPLKPPTRR